MSFFKKLFDVFVYCAKFWRFKVVKLLNKGIWEPL
ncbi:hypothetical protein BDK88_4259 [Natrinema hispanicum]|uniref:Uncharacterized protein n=1 Tax=Natrinema hispanicum TaxID=392421 RepID=A0A482Y5Y9_9EURY|nr:hypothetical protein BDK88_4259 [Natrinema hispanicum]